MGGGPRIGGRQDGGARGRGQLRDCMSRPGVAFPSRTLPKWERETEKLSPVGQDFDSPPHSPAAGWTPHVQAAWGLPSGEEGHPACQAVAQRAVDRGLSHPPCDHKSPRAERLLCAWHSASGFARNCCSVRHKASRDRFADGANEAQRGQAAYRRSHSREAAGMGRVNAACPGRAVGAPRGSRATWLPASPGPAFWERQMFINQHISFFPFGIWMWFHFEPRTSENETRARVTVTVGGEENPRGLGDLCLSHHGFHNQDLVSGEEGTRPTVQARSPTL